MKRMSHKDSNLKYVNFRIPIKYIDMIDKLSCKYADGNRTKMFIQLIENECQKCRIGAGE